MGRKRKAGSESVDEDEVYTSASGRRTKVKAPSYVEPDEDEEEWVEDAPAPQQFVDEQYTRFMYVEKILDWRVVKADETEERKEYLLKWKGRSYLHAEWIPVEEIEAAAKSIQGLSQKYRNFQNKVELAPGAVLEEEDGSHGLMREEWTQVDRIISKRQSREGLTEYLVKWKELGYEECTWEYPEDISAYEDEISRFENLKPRKKQKAAVPEAESSKKRKRIMKVGEKQGGVQILEKTPTYLTGGELHPYQLEGLNWLRYARQRGKHVILADEMGLGKTIQTISFLASLIAEGTSSRPHLVVAPLSTLRNWEREFTTWTPHLNVVMYLGSSQARNIIRQYEFYYPKDAKEKTKSKKDKGKEKAKDAKQERLKFDVLLTSYETVLADQAILRSLRWECLVVDEGHRLKSKDSKLFQALHNFHTIHRTLLTGTPLQNNLDELFMLMHFLDATKFGSLESFQEEFANIAQEEQVARLHKLLAPHLLRRMKKDVMKQLPPKHELIVRVELSPLQKKYYKAVLERNYQVLTKRGGHVSLTNIVMELRKVCGHPYLIEGAEPEVKNPEEASRRFIESSGKLALLDKMMRKLKAQGHRVIIFSQFTRVLDLLEDWLVHHKWEFERIDGGVNGAQRQVRIDRFNAPGSPKFVFLLSTRAGGLGINLATADTVVIYDSDWNPHNDLQAMARAHRMGQKTEVMIYRLITRASIEERMMQMTKKKMMLEHLVVGKMTTQKSQNLNQEELDDILRYGAKELFAEEGEGDQKKQSRSIYYDEAAVDRLLDRTQAMRAAAEAAAAEGEVQESEYLKAFKVANFALMEEDEEEGVGGIEAEDEARVDEVEKGPKGKDYWDDMFRARIEEEAAKIKEEMGKGRRSRRQVTQHVDEEDKGLAGMEDASSDSDFEQEPKYPSSEDVSDIEQIPDKRRKFSTPPPVGFTPLLQGEGRGLKVLGFNHKQRATFVKTLMQFGLDDASWNEIVTRLHPKPEEEIHEYAALFLSHLAEEEKDAGEPKSEFYKDGVPREGLKVPDVLVRIAILHLIRKKYDEIRQNRTQIMFEIASDQWQHTGPFGILKVTKVWSEQHDKKLLEGVVKHGYGQWRDIVNDKELNLEGILKEELQLGTSRDGTAGLENRQGSGEALEVPRENLKEPLDVPKERIEVPKEAIEAANGEAKRVEGHEVDPQLQALAIDGYVTRRMMDFLKRRIEKLERALNTEYHNKQMGREVVVVESEEESEPEATFLVQQRLAEQQAAFQQQQMLAMQQAQHQYMLEMQARQAEAIAQFLLPFDIEREIIPINPDNNMKRIQAAQRYNELCLLLKATHNDALAAYSGNKSAGQRMRKTLRTLDTLCITLRDLFKMPAPRPAQKLQEERPKPGEDGEETQKPEEDGEGSPKPEEEEESSDSEEEEENEEVPPGRASERVPPVKSFEEVPPVRFCEVTPPVKSALPAKVTVPHVKSAEQMPPGKSAEPMPPVKSTETSPPVRFRAPGLGISVGGASEALAKLRRDWGRLLSPKKTLPGGAQAEEKVKGIESSDEETDSEEEEESASQSQGAKRKGDLVDGDARLES